jgi:hypothetical protein
MSTTKIVFHYVFMGWFAWATFSIISTIDKSFHWAIRWSMAALGICTFAALFLPTYLYVSGEPWDAMSDVMMWLYIGLLVSGALAQAAFVRQWVSKHTEKIYSRANVTSIVLEDALRRRRA